MLHNCMGTAVAQWLRYYATNQKVAGSIPAGISGFFIDIKSFRLHYGPGVTLKTGILISLKMIHLYHNMLNISP